MLVFVFPALLPTLLRLYAAAVAENVAILLAPEDCVLVCVQFCCNHSVYQQNMYVDLSPLSMRAARSVPTTLVSAYASYLVYITWDGEHRRAHKLTTQHNDRSTHQAGHGFARHLLD